MQIKENIFTKIARFIKYNKLFTIFIIIFSLLLSLYLFGDKGLIDRVKLESDKTKLENSLKEEQQKTESLQKELNEIKTSEYKLESVAREKYGLTKEGEKIYKVLTDTIKNNE
ncbi:MAG TPA: hypothetical protein DEP28_04400 [Bacteroidetes bacterium]|nr:septum formation initiator family protein [Ignavibacteria bacterium]HCA42475.1 hypothetical protein [Bacteroidota bacterium]HCN37122.1 hypothetical protein [Bacteroidota bacterium]